ncbi:PRC-barrel domain-containing protein [Rhizobium sp. L1K21]|uniref:PRC-barrel domain-containing protein n=1 Tax=Rhizobium sp. L1K21 TaxID=2954933 RepID=UPI002092C654|nr:PRC-barrel domain-containing protein [Rhizobium sp. L1K21]MCO6185362.1 PRC-barrel domain-containing protein [Rhizobium sp. L1K21]
MLTGKLLATNALLLTMVTPVFAQEAPQVDPIAPTGGTMEMNDGAAPATSPGDTAGAQTDGGFIAAQAEGQWLASDYIGQNVMSSGGETVAEINDVIVDQDGTVSGFTLSVGGFLGMGDRTVAVPADAIQTSTDENGAKTMMLNTSVEQVEAAPEFVTLKAAKLEEERAKAVQESEQMNSVPAAPLEPAN